MCFRPDTQALRLQNVNLYCMRHVGVKVLLVDADNTLCPWNSPDLSPEVIGWVEEAKSVGFAVLVASNSSLQRLRPLSEKLRIGVLPRAGKPLPFRLRRAARQLGFSPRQCAMIGDQILTDVMAGKLAGMHTVLLEPIDRTSEFRGTRINRVLERGIKKLWRIP